MATPPKDTVYIDIDDEITTIIDKLRASDSKVVALVLPKRAAVLQSIVNMRLLKRAADEDKKNLVLITTEAGLLPLAGAAGVHVAKTLTSKPEIPQAPATDDNEETVDEDESGRLHDPEITAAIAGGVAVGALAGLPPKDEVETVELDDDVAPEDSDDTESVQAAAPVKPKDKKNKKLAIPDFDRFRLLLFGGIFLLILLIVGFVFANNVLPKATITIKTDASNVNVSLPMNLSTTATKLDMSNNTVPAKQVQQQKTYSQQAPATGQQNNGDKSTGTITVINCGPSNTTIPAGTGFSSSGHTFISQQTVSVPASNFTFGGHCKNDGTASVNVTAQTGGASSNLSSGAVYSIAISGSSYLSATGSAMTGGTDNIQTVVSQADIDGAKAKITTDDASVKTALQQQLTQAGYYAITATYNAGTPTVTSSANAGDAASSVTVTEVVTSTMLGAHQADLQTLIKANVDKQIDTSKQSIIDYGLAQASFTVNSPSATGANVTMQTTAIVGPQLDTDQIKKDAAGKKAGEVKAQLSSQPGVTDVEVTLSPFWVTTVPGNPDKVTVNIAKPTNTVNSSANGSNP